MMANQINPHQLLVDADLLFSAEHVKSAIESIASNLNSLYGADPVLVLCVMNGGAYFLGQIMPLLTFPLELDYVHATRYQGGTVGQTIQWLAEPPAHAAGKKVLILDDILDEGVTLKAIVDACEQLGAVSVTTAVLLEKTLVSEKAVKADYVGLTVENRYVFGCGMDVHGWWRNLPQVYALKAT